MGKIPTKMPMFCLSRIRPLVRVRSSPLQTKDQESSTHIGDEETKDDCSGVELGASVCGGERSGAIISGRKVMVVVDSSMEAKNALQWALSHTVQNHDTLVLLHVIKPSKQGGDQTNVNPKLPELLNRIKSSCIVKRPEVHVEATVVEGQDKGLAIVKAARAQSISLLVVGQKKPFITWRLMLIWAKSHRAPIGGIAEYCVQNATCMAIAVRRKSKKLGGYLISTKRHKDFWLLA